MNAAVFKIFVILVMVFGVQEVIARPSNRVKRVSDSHLADLETKIALNNHNKMRVVTTPIRVRIDPLIIGRRRRSQSRFLEFLFSESDEDNSNLQPTDYNDFLYNYKNRSPNERSAIS